MEGLNDNFQIYKLYPDFANQTVSGLKFNMNKVDSVTMYFKTEATLQESFFKKMLILT